MERTKPRSVAVGDAECSNCGKPGTIKANKKGHLYLYCLSPPDGGCGGGFTSRSDAADLHAARRVKKWRDPAYRRAYLGEAPARDPAKAPAPDPVPAPDPAPAPKPKGDGLFS